MISFQAVQTSSIPQLCDELGKQPEFKRAFPTIKRGAFHRSVLSVHQLHDGKDVAGFLLKTVPPIPFKAYGDRESLLMIYPQYQRQGIGTSVLNLIHEDREPGFFVAAKCNPASTAFFQKQQGLKLVGETERCRVYSRS